LCRNLKKIHDYNYIVYTTDLTFPAPAIGAFNSPSLGTRTAATITVTSAEANGEIGFHSIDTLTVSLWDLLV